MKVSDLRRLLSQLPQDMEVMSYQDEMGFFQETGEPEIQKIRFYYNRILNEDRWEHAKWVDKNKMLKEKIIVRI